MSLAVDWLGTVQSIYYQPFNCSYRNGWQIRKGVHRMTVKIKLIHKISYELHEYMPCCFPSLSSLFLLILLL